MTFLSAICKLSRWPNLLFILLTQFLFWAIVLPYVYNTSLSSHETIKTTRDIFLLLAGASVLIAAAGYIINDYFDVDIDHVNKEGKVLIGTVIKKRTAILLHAFFSVAGLALSIYAGYKLSNYYIPFFNALTILLLWLYSTTFKKTLLTGNILISVLTAWTILVLTLAEYRFRVSADDIAWQKIIKISFLYAGFAFILSLVREVIKDLEDMPGDSRYGCRTMPLVWGIAASKVFAGVWMVVLCGLLAALFIYMLQFGWWLVSLYAVAALILPGVHVIRELKTAETPADYHRLSTRVKLIMMAGILSMLFFLMG